MAWNIPLPGVSPEGGDIYNAMLKNQEFAKNLLENYYYGPTSQAANLSKLAYANLMGPQFLAKLMGKEDILANMTPEQQKKALDIVYRAGAGQQNFNPFQLSSGHPRPTSFLERITNDIKNAFGITGSPKSSQDQNAFNNMTAAQQFREAYPEIDKAMQDQFQRTGESQFVIPGKTTQIPQPPVSDQLPTEREPSFAEKTGTYAGIKAEGKEAGKIRAKDIKDFGDQYESSLTRSDSFKELAGLATSPAFQQMRSKIPFFQDKQLKLLSKIGTKEEQQMIGKFITTAQEIVKDTVNSFKGQRLKGELTVAQNMKVSDDDTFDVMLGKLQAAMLYNEMGKTRSSLASNIMRTKHFDKQKALEEADTKIDGDKIRNQINNLLNPKPTEEDINYMANKYKVSPDEIRKRLKDKGII